MAKVISLMRLSGLIGRADRESGRAENEVISTRSTRHRAEAAQARRDWAAARDLWQEVVTQTPDDVGAWIQLGNMFNELADYATALKVFKEATLLNSQSFDGLAGQAGVHERAGDWANARDIWLAATQTTTDLEQLGHAYCHAVLSAHMTGDPASLGRVTIQATAALPGFLERAENLLLRARLLRRDQPKTAKLLLNQRLKDCPEDESSRFELASICLEASDFFEGLATLEPCLSVEGIPGSFLWLATDLYERLNLWRNVIDICDRVVASGSTEPRFMRRGFDAAVRLGDLPSARRYAIRFSVIAQGELRLVDELRAAYESAGETRRAALLCRWISKCWPHSHWHMGHAIKLVAASAGLMAADRLAQRTIAKHGRNLDVDAAYCHSAFSANEPAEAHRRFTWYLAGLGHDDLSAQVTLGYVLANSVGIHEAEQHFLFVAASNFQTKAALIGLAHMASRRRDQRATLECWTRVSAMYPDDTVARVEQARSLYNYGEQSLARSLCERRLADMPSDTTMGEFYLWLLVATGDDETAQAYLPKLVQFCGPSWDALQAAILSAGRLGLLEQDWLEVKRLLPSASHMAASSRLYHITRLLMYFEKPVLAAELVNLSNIERRHASWLAPYLSSKQLAVESTLQLSAQKQWRQTSTHITNGPARHLDAMSSNAVYQLLGKPMHDLPRVHIVNKFEQPRGGSELHALDLAERLSRYARVELWAPEMPHPSFSANQNVQSVDRSQGRAPFGGVIVFIGIYFPIDWIAFAKPERIIFLYNTFEAPALYLRVQEAATLTGVAVELLFCSDMIGDECGLPGRFEPSPIDISLFSAVAREKTESNRVRPFTVGRHSRDVVEKHHWDDKSVYEAVAMAGGRTTLLGAMCMRSAFRGTSKLDLLPASTTGIVGYLRGLDTYFYRTSTWVEPWGRVVVEAMACEVPVLVHDVGGYSQIIQHEKNGLLFHTTAEAVGQIRRLEADPSLRRRLATAGRATVEELLGEDSMARLAAFYFLQC